MRCVRRFSSACAVAAVIVSAGLAPALAQSGDPKAAEQQRLQDAAKDGGKKADELAEVAKSLGGGAAANAECVWIGRRAVNLLWRDDLDTAFRHMELYDRFGCPTQHLQKTFRCAIRLGSIDPKQPESLGQRVHACWVNPELQTPPAAAAPAAGAPPAAPPQGAGAPAKE